MALVGQSAEINDAAHAGALRRARKVLGGATVDVGEIGAAAHRMHQVVGGLHANQRAVERRLVEAVALHDLGRRHRRVEPPRLPDQAPHCAAAIFEPSKKAAADVSRGAGQQNGSVHAGPTCPSAQDHRVDHVNDAVAGDDVGLHDVRVVNGDGAAVRRDQDRVAADRLGRVQLDHVRGHHVSRHDVIREDALQLRLVLGLEQRLECSGRQLRERLVGRREHRERARALERADQIRGGERLRERLERPGGDRRVNDVLAVCRGARLPSTPRRSSSR